MGVIKKYGLEMSGEGVSDLEMELHCFRAGRSSEEGGLGRCGHFKKVVKIVWPGMVWHPWMEDRIRALSNGDFVAWVGCAASGKTHDAALYAMVWWLAAPTESTVVLTSTTGKSIRRRMWPVIQELYHAAAKVPLSGMCAAGFPGNMVDSKTTLQSVKGDDKHCIAALPVADGPVARAVGDIKGFHPKKRMLLVVDEANDTPEAVFQSISNLRKGLQEFQMLVIGNPVSRLDPHGFCCEPVMGWESVGVDDDEWQTKGVPKWEIKAGICQHFDGVKSPNMNKKDPIFPFIITRDDVESSRNSNQGEDTLGFWSHTRGFWPPDGMCSSVFTESLVLEHDGRGKHRFRGGTIHVAGLDPSFTADGDGCVLRFGVMGEIGEGRIGIELKERVKIPIRAGEDIYFQIARAAADHCRKRGMSPGDLAVDVTGGGKGVADVISNEWGHGVHRVEFGSKPTNRPVSNHDGRPSSDVYHDRVTELWYVCREFLVTGQLKGLDERSVVEFCSREVGMKGRKLQVAAKHECKRTIGRSPDDADAVAVLIDLVRQKGGKVTALGQRSWEKVAQAAQDIYQEPASQWDDPVGAWGE